MKLTDDIEAINLCSLLPQEVRRDSVKAKHVKQGQGNVDNLPDEEDPVYVEISNRVEIIDLTEDAEDGESGLEKHYWLSLRIKEDGQG